MTHTGDSDATQGPEGRVRQATDAQEAYEEEVGLSGGSTRRLVLMVGLPQSGKSRFARELSIPIVSPDAIRLAMHGNAYLPLAEPWVWVMAKTMAAALFEAGHVEVLIDACNNTMKRRLEWIILAKQLQIETVTTIMMDTPVQVCLERAETAGRDDLMDVIKRMAEQHEPVDFELEGLKGIYVS